MCSGAGPCRPWVQCAPWLLLLAASVCCVRGIEQGVHTRTTKSNDRRVHRHKGTRRKRKSCFIQPSGVQHHRSPRGIRRKSSLNDSIHQLPSPTQHKRSRHVTKLEGYFTQHRRAHGLQNASRPRCQEKQGCAEECQTSAENKKRWDGIRTSLSGLAQNISGESVCLSRKFVRCAPRAHDKWVTLDSGKGLSAKTTTLVGEFLRTPSSVGTLNFRRRNERCVVALGPVVLVHIAHTDYSY